MEEQNYGKHPDVGKKGNCFLLFLVAVIVFVILLIWVYNMNFKLTF